MTAPSTTTAPAIPFSQSGSSPPASSPQTTPDPQTLAIHSGLAPDPATGAILTPIHQAATFAQPALGQTISPDGHTYSRCSNPTVTALERNLAGLENVDHALAFKTGLAAITTLLFTVLKPGDHVIAGEVIYGGTVRLLRDLFGGFGVESSFVDTTDPAAVAAALRPNTKLVLIETPGNPTLAVTDLAAVGALAHKAGALFAVDNTFLTAVQQPVFCHGADIAILSTTKYVEGHNSTTGGALLTQDGSLHERLFLTRSATGCIQAPFDAWLTLRGLKTLPLRLERHSATALSLASFLEGHPAVTRVHYPGLESSPSFQLCQAQQSAGGGMVAFEVTPAAVPAFLGALELITLAENLGAAESLITHPATMTHSQIPPETRARLGIGDGLLRLSVGLEGAADLQRDLEAGFACITEVQA
ncbi:MAG: cystathionine beta-lyase/cystathionine gamma-synthase [Planctomycetota bacterium]|jgi:cystathionine beta-lyase/cystathionine gamma-synthase